METDKKYMSYNNVDNDRVNDHAAGTESDTFSKTAGDPVSDADPEVAVLMAVFEPRQDWLAEQLQSLDRQTVLDGAEAEHCPVRLYVRDDASRTVSQEEILECIRENLQRIPFSFFVNRRNMGSTAVFEQLTQEAEAAWFAYCDQDDIWEPDKLEKLLQLAEESRAVLVCSDMRMIDENGNVLADSITDLRPRHRFSEGTGLAGQLIYRNFVTGCTALMKSDLAKQAVPFAKSMVHDHYLAFFSALHGPIAVCREPLVRYRQHKGNQTGVLHRIRTKEEYIELHIGEFAARSAELLERFGDMEPELKTARRWCRARARNAARLPGGMRQLWKLRKVNRSTSMFELIGLRLPAPFFRLVLKWIQTGRI